MTKSRRSIDPTLLWIWKLNGASGMISRKPMKEANA